MIFPRPVKNFGDCIACGILTRGGNEQDKWDTTNRRLIEFEGQNWKASRLAYHLNVQSLPRTPATLKEGIVCHHCDNQWCINPAHLYLGTARQNTKDIYARNSNIIPKKIASAIGNTNARGKCWSEEARKRRSEALIGNRYARGKGKHQRAAQVTHD